MRDHRFTHVPRQLVVHCNSEFFVNSDRVRMEIKFVLVYNFKRMDIAFIIFNIVLRFTKRDAH